VAVSAEIRREFLEQAAGPVSDEQMRLLGSFGRILLASADRVNLMSRLQLDRLGEQIVDSAGVLGITDPSGLSCVDLGSGNGLPGVVLAILRPAARIALVEARRKKVVVLKKIQRELELRNLEVVHRRIEALPPAGYDLGLSRALGAVESTLAPSLRVICDGGRLVLYKGPGWIDERAVMETVAAREGAQLMRAVPVGVPGTDRVTTLVEFHVERSRGSR